MAQTIIDALVVTLGLDASTFTRDSNRAIRTQQDIADQSRRTTRQRNSDEQRLSTQQERRQRLANQRARETVDGFRSIRNELLSLVAVFTAGAGVKNFISDTINSAANLGYLSANLGMTTERLTSWQKASERAGGTAEGLAAQFKSTAKSIAGLNAGLGPDEGMQWFVRYGGSSKDWKDAETYLLAQSKIVSELFKTSPTQAVLAAQQIGISDDQFNLLKQGPEAVLALVKAQEKNAAITAKSSAEALKLKNEMLELRDRLQSTATRILIDLAPALEKLLLRLQQSAEWVAMHKDDISKWLQQSATAVSAFASAADRAAQAVGGWQNVLLGLATIKVVSMAAGLLQLAASLQAVATAGAGAGVLGVLGKLGAVGAAAGGGYLAGTALYGSLSDDTKNGIGEFIARTRASLGNKEAGEAIRLNTGKDDYLTKEAAKPAAKPVANRGGTSAIVRDRLKAMGWTDEQAAGITASFVQESDLDPRKVNPKSGAYGLGQWTSPRRKDFMAWAGKPIEQSTLDEQLSFFQFEVTKGKEQPAGRKLRAATTAEEAARIHSEAYERPDKDEANIPRRMQLAAQLAATSRMANASTMARMPALAQSSGTVMGGSTSTSTTNIDQIIVQTQATDARGIAREIGPAVEQYSFANQANTGMR